MSATRQPSRAQISAAQQSHAYRLLRNRAHLPCSYFMGGKCHRGNGCLFVHDHEARAQARLEAGDDDADGSATGSGKREKQPRKLSKAERIAM